MPRVVPETTLVERCRAYGERMHGSELFSHITAAELYGIPLPREWTAGDPLHVSSPEARRSPKTRGVIGHQYFDPSVEGELRQGLPVTDPASTWCHLARLLRVDDLVAAGDYLVLDPAVPEPGRPIVDLTELRARASGFRGRGGRAAREAVLLVRDGAESRRETLLRLLIGRSSLPEPDLGVPIEDAQGRFIGRVDMYYPAWNVAIEYDGDQHRTSDTQYDRDQTRLAELADAGVRVVRIRKSAMRDEGREALALIRAALAKSGARW